MKSPNAIPLFVAIVSIALEDLSEGRRFLRHYVPRADGLVDVVGPYEGPLVIT